MSEVHYLSFDLEARFHTTDFMVSGVSSCEGEDELEESVDRFLDLLDKYKVKATFFVLAKVAEKQPDLVRKIYIKGHEIASHGYSHELVYRIRPAEFREDIRRAKNIIENVVGEKVVGYRAPTFSITRRSLWALRILAEEGFKYDSSIFPIWRLRYGMPGFFRYPRKVEFQGGLSIMEIPISTIRIVFFNFPFSGGGYFRVLPYRFLYYGMKFVKGTVVYLHPWELICRGPKVKLKGLAQFRHYCNVDTTKKKLEMLLKNFKFAPLREILYNSPR